MNLEQSRGEAAPQGISDVAFTGAWRAIIARHRGRYKVAYYNENDDPRHVAALRRDAESWLAER